VAEVNAFGDLLPGVLADGRDTYAEQVHALTSGRWERWRAATPGLRLGSRLGSKPASGAVEATTCGI